MLAGETGDVAAAVLVPLFPIAGNGLGVLLTRRHAGLPAHAGEMSFPGGRREPGDPDLLHTALREAQEEIGLGAGQVRVLGELPPVRTFLTCYLITPFVGLIEPEVPFRPAPREVDALFEIPLGELAQSFERRLLERAGRTVESDTYLLGGELVWGATARILSSLFAWLERQDPVSTGTPTRLPHSVQEPS